MDQERQRALQDLDSVTNVVEDSRIDDASAAEAIASLSSDVVDEASASNLDGAPLRLKKEDIQLIVSEMEVTEIEAERELRDHRGDVVSALKAMTSRT